VLERVRQIREVALERIELLKHERLHTSPHSQTLPGSTQPASEMQPATCDMPESERCNMQQVRIERLHDGPASASATPATLLSTTGVFAAVNLRGTTGRPLPVDVALSSFLPFAV
jgi:hypothetical protein